MKFDVFTSEPRSLKADALVVGVYEDAELATRGRGLDSTAFGIIKTLRARGDFSGRLGDTLLLPDPAGLSAKRLVLVGLGSRAQYARKSLRRALAAAVSALARTRVKSVAFALELPASGVDAYVLGRLAAEVTLVSLYRVNDLKSGRKPRPAAIESVLIGPVSAAQAASARRGLEDGAAIGGGIHAMRDLANLPANVCTPSYLARAVRDLSRRHPSVRVRVFDEAGIRRLGMGCFLAVTRGSEEPPRFIVAEYRSRRAGARRTPPVVLVGKGITFDSGGISLKDPPGMDEMKFDMSGAAAVIATLGVVATLELPLDVVVLVPACENMPSGRAVKPGDIVTSASGQTVEILNTDAEGRLVLCDALHYARRYKPQVVVDVATLTGACVVALGAHHTGIMSNTDELAAELVGAGRLADDRAWQLPLTEEYGEQLKSNFADMANVAGRDGGAITAAAFLAKFTHGLKWAHLDIAGSAYVGGAQKGSTGRPVALLSEFLIRRARGQAA
jgi:leucyl aminopeptidase